MVKLLKFYISFIFLLKDIIWLGPQMRASVEDISPNNRTAGFFGAVAGIYISKNILFGYAYQGTTANKYAGIKNSSNEFLIRIHLFPKTRGKLRSPRLF